MKWLFLFLIPLNVCFSLSLKEKFVQAEAGSFIVTEQNKTFTLLHLFHIDDKELLLEEISVPSHQVSTSQDWKQWVEQGASGSTSWILYAVDLKNNCVTECYSFTQETHLQTDNFNAFLTTLLQMDLEYLPDSERLRTGPSAKAGQAGGAKPWGPSMFREGKKVNAPCYDVYTAKWPADQSELSGKKIILYFDQKSSQFPFPYWVQAREGALHFKVRATDSGTGLSSPKKTLPRRAPRFIGASIRDHDTAVLTLNAPSYFHDFKLYAVDITGNSRQTLTIPATLIRNDQEVRLEANHLSELLTTGHQYMWIVYSEEFDLYAESERPTLWSKKTSND